MHTRNGMSVMLSLPKELILVQAWSWQQEQEVGDFLYTFLRQSFVLILLPESLRTLEDDNHVKKSHPRHRGEKTHPGESQDNHGMLLIPDLAPPSNTCHLVHFRLKQVSLCLSILPVRLGICFNIQTLSQFVCVYHCEIDHRS